MRPAPALAAAPIVTKALLNAAELLGLSRTDMGHILGISVASASRLGRTREIQPDSKEGELALLFLRVFRSLDSLLGGDESAARQWLHADNRHLEGVPARLLQRVDGLVRVAEYLDGDASQGVTLDVWSACLGERHVRRLRARPFRVVEAQHLVSTRKLVDTSDEQRILEGLIDGVKPRMQHDASGLHFLLSTPFRYPPLPHGSRFGTRRERGIWYGSRGRTTAFAETAYYRLLFLSGTSAALLPRSFELSIFQAAVATRHGVDLTKPPFEAHRTLLASKTDYRATQALGARARAAGVEVLVYESARDPAKGHNVAVLNPAPFSRRSETPPETWVMHVSAERVELSRKDFFRSTTIAFKRSDFLADGGIPEPST